MSNPTGDALKAYRNSLVITDEHRTRAWNIYEQMPEHQGNARILLAAALAQIEQDTARRCAEIAFKIGKPVGGGDGGTYVPGTSSDAWRAIRAAFNIKD